MQQGKYEISTAFSDSFDLLKQRPLWCLGWGAILLIVPYSLVLPFLPWLIANIDSIVGEETGVEALSGLQLISNLASVVQMLLIIPVIAAIIRLILDRSTGRTFWGLRLGRDELWVFVCNVALFAVFFVGAMLVVLIVILGAAVMGVSRVASGGLLALGTGFGLSFVGVLIWLSIRLSLVLPASVDLDTLALRQAWRASKGQFWPLFGTALLALLAVTVLSMLWIILAMVVILLAGLVGPATGMVSFGDEASFSEWVPLIIGGGLLMLAPTCWLTAASYVLYMAPFASAWRQLRPRPVVADEAPFERM